MFNGIGQPGVQFASNATEVGVDGQVSIRRCHDPFARGQGLVGKCERTRHGNREVACQIDGNSHLLDVGQRDAAGKPTGSPFEAAHGMPRQDVVEILLWDTKNKRRRSRGYCPHCLLLEYEEK